MHLVQVAVDFLEGLRRDFTEFSCLVMKALEPSLRNCRDTGPPPGPKRSKKYILHRTSTTVWSKLVVFRIVDIDLCGLREPLENRPCAVSHDLTRLNVLIER